MKVAITTILFLATSGISVRPQVPIPQHYAIGTTQIVSSVVQAFADNEIQITDGQVTVPTHPVAIETDPILDIASVEPLTKQIRSHSVETTVKARVVCHKQGACVPFYVLVTLPDSMSVRKFRTVSSDNLVRHDLGSAQFAMHPGGHATLLLDDDRAKIEIPVVSLENGSEGQMIHVTSLDHRHVYLAEVVSATVVKGRF
jgi:hypothetical protein